MTSEAPPSLPPRYEDPRPLGAGGMGVVWLVRDRVLGRDVAMKCIRPEIEAQHQLRRRFQREIDAMARVNHPNVVRLLEQGEHGGALYLVMEYLEGDTLRARLARGGLGARPAAELAADLCEGLAAVHQAGLCHRDLKPGNVFITREGIAKLMDFGLVRLEDDQSRTALTRTGQVVGTAKYLPPEVLRGARADARSDVFQLGLILGECLEGVEAGPGLRALVAAATDPDPAARPAAAALAARLRAWLVDSAVSEPASSADETSRFQAADERPRGTRALARAAVGLAGAVAVLLAVTLLRPPAPASPAAGLPLARVVAGPAEVSQARPVEGWSGLHHAAWNGRTAEARALLDGGAAPGDADEGGWTPLHLAAARGHAALVSLLLERSAAVDPRDQTGRTPLRWAAEAGHDSCMAPLMAGGADEDALDELGRTPLHGAASFGRLSIIRALLKAGARADLADAAGQTALHRAASHDHAEACAALVAAGVPVDARDTAGGTALLVAVRSQRQAAARALVKAGADPRVADVEGNGPLNYAVVNGFGALVEVLLEAGAEPARRNVFGEDALGQALGRGRPEIVDRIRAWQGRQAPPGR